MAIATPTDVANRLGRDLDTSETKIVTARLDDAEAMILARIPGALDRASTNAGYEKLLVMVECDAALRIVRNTSGITSESAVDYSVSFSASAATGVLEITDAEWSMLGVPRAFVIQPSYEPRAVPLGCDGPGWYPWR